MKLTIQILSWIIAFLAFALMIICGLDFAGVFKDIDSASVSVGTLILNEFLLFTVLSTFVTIAVVMGDSRFHKKRERRN